MLDYEKLGTRVRTLRKAKGWTQEFLAEQAKIEPSNLSHIERAATKVSLPTLVRIANALETSLDELVYDSLDKSAHVSSELINKVLSDCTDSEVRALAYFLAEAKRLMRGKL